MRKNKKENKFQKQYGLSAVTFLLGFQLSLTAYILSSFIQELTGIENIGVFFLIAYGASFYILINLHHLIKKYGKSKIFLLFLVIKFLALLAIAIYAESMTAVVFAIWFLVSDAVSWVTLDIMIESFSQDKTTGVVRGLHITLMNVGFLFGPFLATWTVHHLGFGFVFLATALVNLAAMIILFLKYRNVNHEVKRDVSALAVLSKMMKRKDLMRIYYASFMLGLFYAVMAVYTPLYLLSIGFSWLDIGKIITVMIIPFVILEIPLGIIADEKTGEKEWLIIGVLFLSIATGAMSFYSEPNILIWMGILFATRIGASIMEVMRDTYFYKKIGPEDVDFIDFFRTTKSTSYIFGMTLFSLFLIFFPLKMVFIMLAILVFTALAPIIRLHDTR